MESTKQVKKLKAMYKKNPDICIVDFDIPLAIYSIKSVIVKDILEENVPEKYFIPKERSDEIIRIANLKRADRKTDLVGTPPEEGDYVKHNHLGQNGKLSDKISGTITCIDAPHVVCISNSASTGKKSQCNSVYDEDGLAPTLAAGTHGYATGNILVRGEIILLYREGESTYKENGKVFETEGLCPTLDASQYKHPYRFKV